MKRSNLINNACIYNKYITTTAFQILNNLEIVLNRFLLKYIIFRSSKTASVLLSLSTAHIPLRTNGDTTPPLGSKRQFRTATIFIYI